LVCGRIEKTSEERSKVIKHDTASTFVFCRFTDGWRLGLVEDLRLGLHMIAGGHVEDVENHEQAAIRQITEKMGLAGVRLMSPPTPGLPAGYPHRRVAREWWKTEVMVPADDHLAEPHIHLDHQYLALADTPAPARTPRHPFDWFTCAELHPLAMPQDTRMLAEYLFDRIGDLAAGELDDPAVLRSFAIAGNR
jgi:ADP-ribose pyrophosphatase YjhB (NUDIX family)